MVAGISSLIPRLTQIAFTLLVHCTASSKQLVVSLGIKVSGLCIKEITFFLSESDGTPELFELMDALYNTVADKWKSIGIRLKIPIGKLNATEKCKNDPHTCLMEMLEMWLEQSDPPATWTAVIEAVEFVGHEQLGKELRIKYVPSTIEQ